MRKNVLFSVILGLGLLSISATQANPLKQLTDSPFYTFLNPETIVQKQFRAYNSRDVETFTACFSEDVEVYLFPDDLLYKGKEKLYATYKEFFEKTPDLNCELIERSVNGNKVMDKVSITRVKKSKAMLTTIMYKVEDGLITKMYFIN